MLETRLCGARLKNPTVLASGFLGVAPATLERVGRCGAGAVTMKSVGPKEWRGNPNPTVVANPAYMLNAVGLPSAGYRNMDGDWPELEGLRVPLIGSCYGYTVNDFADIARDFCKRKIIALELDMSCPHFDKYKEGFAGNAENAARVVAAVKKVSGRVPVFAKLSMACADIGLVARACERAGADGITAINTMPAMAIDVNARKPVLGNKVGGLSGKALKPIAVRAVWECYNAVKVPIIATGGVSTGEDAIEMVLAGGTAIGIGTATYSRGLDVFKKVCNEMEAWMQKNNVKSLNEIRGCAHEA